jgi:hypothetical protein
VQIDESLSFFDTVLLVIFNFSSVLGGSLPEPSGALAEAVPALPERPPSGLLSRGGTTKEWQLSPRALLQPPSTPGPPRLHPAQLYRAAFNYTATKPDEIRSRHSLISSLLPLARLQEVLPKSSNVAEEKNEVAGEIDGRNLT